jgi:hypothetical protein
MINLKNLSISMSKSHPRLPESADAEGEVEEWSESESAIKHLSPKTRQLDDKKLGYPIFF